MMPHTDLLGSKLLLFTLELNFDHGLVAFFGLDFEGPMLPVNGRI
jgi:hypothetical protein